MVKNIVAIVFLSLSLSINSYAQDVDRIGQLEKEIEDLNLRVSKLESLLNKKNEAQKPAILNEGWKSIQNWRKLTTNMDTNDVQKLLGDPQRVDGGRFTTWYYENYGMVMFIEGEVNRWTEPRD